MKKRKMILWITIILIVINLFPANAIGLKELNQQLNSKYMILVNRSHKVASNYVPTDLVTYPGSSLKLEKVCAQALQQMINACYSSVGGERLVLYSGYRSYQTQYNKYYGKINYYISKGYSRAKAQQLTDQYYAPPGGSEHHTGLAADICTPAVVNRYAQLHESFATTKQGVWLRNNCHKYGFILRYDQGKESITGYNFEPWHFRYVGKEHAEKIFNSKLTYEEYHAKLLSIKSKISTKPKITVTGGKIYLTSASGTEIRYTVDNSTPSSKSTKYSSPLSKKNTTYKAVACIENYQSAVTLVTITPYGDIFKDISTTDWHYSIISQAVNKNIFSGMGDYYFMPNTVMTRAMLVQVLANISGVNLTKYNGKTGYKDVKKSAWYAPAIQWATQQGIVQGMGDGYFSPESPLTREQACTIFYNHSKDTKHYSLPSFKDKNDISSWAINGVSYCAAKKIVSGYPDGYFLPRKSATRAEIARIALSYLNK